MSCRIAASSAASGARMRSSRARASSDRAAPGRPAASWAWASWRRLTDSRCGSLTLRWHCAAPSRCVAAQVGHRRCCPAGTGYG